MKDILRIMNEYGQAFEQINGTYKQAESYINANYVKGSSIYESTLSSALDTRRQALTPLMDKSKGAIKESLTKARNKVQKAILTQPTPEMMSMIELVKTGKFNDTEKAMMMESVKGNYIASKLMAEATGTQFSTPVESILDALDNIEQITSQHWSYEGVPSNSYNSRMLMHESGYLNQVDGEINEFLSAYGSAEE